MELSNLTDLLKHELDDLYSAEKQITKALPNMSKAATSPALQAAFNYHLDQTGQHITRLDQAYQQLGLRPGRHKCAAMEGLLKEGADLIATESDPEVLDAALIGAAQRVEHYEMAAYGCARTYARLLGAPDVVKLLQTTLDEEGQTDKKLTSLAESGINVAAKATDKRSTDGQARTTKAGNGQAARTRSAVPTTSGQRS